MVDDMVDVVGDYAGRWKRFKADEMLLMSTSSDSGMERGRRERDGKCGAKRHSPGEDFRKWIQYIVMLEGFIIATEEVDSKLNYINDS